MANFIDDGNKNCCFSQPELIDNKQERNLTMGGDQLPPLSVAICSMKQLDQERMIMLLWARGAGTEKYPDECDRLIGQVNIKLNNENIGYN